MERTFSKVSDVALGKMFLWYAHQCLVTPFLSHNHKIGKKNACIFNVLEILVFHFHSGKQDIIDLIVFIEVTNVIVCPLTEL